MHWIGLDSLSGMVRTNETKKTQLYEGKKRKMLTSFFATFSLTHWMDTLSSTYFQFVVLFFLAND